MDKKNVDTICTKENCDQCPNMKEVGTDWNTEYHRCDKCGLSYKIYEEELQ